MANLIFILSTLVLLVAFFLLTQYEARSGRRLFALRRERLDVQVQRMQFVVTHVDFGSFLREEAFRLAGRIGHDVAHVSLRAVRAVERGLTRFVRYLRAQHNVDVKTGDNTREFVKTLSDFKGRLKETMPEVSEIQ